MLNEWTTTFWWTNTIDLAFERDGSKPLARGSLLEQAKRRRGPLFNQNRPPYHEKSTPMMTGSDLAFPFL